jgi:hypothetical protein
MLTNAVSAPETLTASARGFGNVTVTLRSVGAASETVFAAEDSAHAAIVGSKRLADLLGFGDLAVAPASGLPGTVLELKGAGVWLLGLDGVTFHELYAPTRTAMAKLATDCGAAKWKQVPANAYPRWLDCFDNAGPAIWFGGGGAPVDIDTDFPWMQKRRIAFNMQPPDEGRYVAPGLLDTTTTDWFGAMAKKYDLPYRTMLWEQKPSWLWNRQSLPYVQRAAGTLPPNFDGARMSLYGSWYGSEPVSASDPYSFDFRRRFSAGLDKDPNFVGSMVIGEVPEAGINVLSAVAGMPETKAYWHSYLVNALGLDLPKVGSIHHGRSDYYKSWDQVEVPTQRDFLGLDAGGLILNGTWDGLADRAKAGVAAKWYAPDTMPKDGWVSVDCNDPMLMMYNGGQGNGTKHADYWLKRTVTVSASQLATLKYLQVTRQSQYNRNFCDAYLNAQPLKKLTADDHDDLAVCFDATTVLHEGQNQLVLRMDGLPPAGIVALTPLPLRHYPNMTEPENRLWFDGVNFSAWLRMRGIEQRLQAMRAGDPNRPLKIMATINMLDMSTDLCERYGAYQHDTGGAGGYWCPMTGARLARSHGMPWSCEQGGPPNNAMDMQSAISFYVMYGNDAVDLVFATTHYKDKPDVAAWFDKNLELIRCVGKMHLPTPKIGILRSTRVTRLGFAEPWNWDMARGALQGVGRNFNYIEVPDLYNGVIDQFPVVMDCGTVVMTPDDVQAILRYVRRGGTFIAQHHTARNLPERADAWPLAHALGLTVTPKWMTEANFNQWKLAKMKVSEDQDILPKLRGQTIEGSGVAIDYLGKEHSAAVSFAAAGGSIKPVATWTEDKSMAVAEAKLGRGRVIMLGTPFYTRMRDQKGMWVNDADRSALFDEFLTAVGVPRDSWSPVWAERWQSKNGLYDLYPVARMNRTGAPTIATNTTIRREAPITEVEEISALGHPKVKVAWADGKFTLPTTDFEQMQTRIYVAPRADIGRSALDWFHSQSDIWRTLPIQPALATPAEIPVPSDILPAAEEWRMTTDTPDASWTQPGFNDAAWKTVKLGTFPVIGIPDDAVGTFRKTLTIPKEWSGRRVTLNFDCNWSYGVVPQGRLWIDGQLAPVRQPLMAWGASDFTVDVTKQAEDGTITLALQIDGSKTDKTKPRGRPTGVTGMFFLDATSPGIQSTPLAGPWFAARDVNVLTPATVGQKATFVYLETKFTLPASWPSKKVYLESPDKLGWIILNNQIINADQKTLDVTGLVTRTGENRLRRVPNLNGGTLEMTREQTNVVPELSLVWKN